MHHYDPAPDALYADGLNLLTEDERTVGLAYTRLIPLLEALQDNPFNATANAELRDYLDHQADDAIAAFTRLRELGPAYLSERLNELSPQEQ